MSVSNLVGLLIVFPAVVVAISLLAWNGRPRAFSRLNWMGLGVGTVIFAFVLAAAASVMSDELQEVAKQTDPFPGYTYTASNPKTGETFGWRDGKWEPLKVPADINRRVADHARAKYRAEVWPQLLRFLVGLFVATSAGSIMAIFFYKPRRTSDSGGTHFP
jgi:uncharacterized membrane protein